MVDGIQVTKSREQPGEASFRVQIAPDLVEQAEVKAAKRLAKQARLPGFRQGKAPLAVVRRKYQDVVREQALREVISDSWKATLEQEKLDPIADPHVHDLKFEAGTPLTFELHVELRPELKLERVGGFTLTRSVNPVSDEAVAGQLEDIRRQRATWVPVEGEPAKPGDLASLSLATVVDGAAQEAKQYRVVLGQGQAIPDVEEQIMRLLPGQTAQADVSFPDDFPDETKRGQRRHVEIAVHEVKRQDLPPLDDAFAREIGDFDSLEAARQAIRADLEQEARREADAGLRRQLIEQIVAANDVPAPRALTDRLIGAYAQAYSIPDERLEDFASEFRTLAESQVRRDLILDHVAKANDLKASEADLDQRVEEIAKRRGVDPGQVYAELQKAKRLKELEQTITEEKVYGFLLAQSTVTEK
jgi:trigger factor